jgi:hypothetical protein
MDVLTDRRSRLETVVSSLEREQMGLTSHLEATVLSSRQIETVKEFATKVAGNLESMNGDFAAMRGLVETLDVQVTLVIEDSKKIVHARCIVGEGSWGLSDITNPVTCQGLPSLTIVFYCYQPI